MCKCAGWSESSLDAHVWRYVFWCCNAFVQDEDFLPYIPLTEQHCHDEGQITPASINDCTINLGPVVQSNVSLTSSLIVKMLNVLISTISNSQISLLKKCE